MPFVSSTEPRGCSEHARRIRQFHRVQHVAREEECNEQPYVPRISLLVLPLLDYCLHGLYRTPGYNTHINALFIPMILAGSTCQICFPFQDWPPHPCFLSIHLAVAVLRLLKRFLRIYSYGLWALALFIPCQAHVSAVRDRENCCPYFVPDRLPAPLSNSNIVISMTPSGIARHRAGSANSFA